MNAEQKMELLGQLYADWKDCSRCGLCSPTGRHRHNVVFGEGNPSASVLIVGEAPGEQEDITGHPFAGRSGEVLDQFLQGCNSSRDEVFVTNVVSCRPTDDEAADENRKPSKDEVKECLPRLHRIIEVVDPYVVIMLGSVAMKVLTGEPRNVAVIARSDTIPSLEVSTEGSMIPLTRPGFVTFHPAYLLRNWSLEEGGDVHKTFKTFLKAFKMADMYAELYHGITPPPRGHSV